MKATVTRFFIDADNNAHLPKEVIEVASNEAKALVEAGIIVADIKVEEEPKAEAEAPKKTSRKVAK